MKKTISVAMVSLLLGGCSGITRVPILNPGQTEGRVMVQTTVTDPHPFSPTHSRSWMEECDYHQEHDRFTLMTKHVYEDCSGTTHQQFATSSGYLDGLGAAALYSGAIVGGAALIGNGIAKSGSTINQNGGGAQADQSQVQTQQQWMEQSLRNQNSVTTPAPRGHGRY